VATRTVPTTIIVVITIIIIIIIIMLQLFVVSILCCVRATLCTLSLIVVIMDGRVGARGDAVG
jgi:hypothetical protein